MTHITNAELKNQLDKLTDRVSGLEDRMNVYEQTAKENTKLLKEVTAGMDFLKSSFRLIKFAGIAIVSAALWQVGTLLFHTIFGH